MSWKCQDDVQREFSFRVRYSDHCISESIDNPPPARSQLFGVGGSLRVFDIDRFEWSKELPTFIEGLFAKPTTAIQMTPEANGYVFSWKMTHPLLQGEKYYFFVRVRLSDGFMIEETPHKIDLFVESAYARITEPFKVKDRPMFGRLVERLLK